MLPVQNNHGAVAVRNQGLDILASLGIETNSVSVLNTRRNFLRSLKTTRSEDLGGGWCLHVASKEGLPEVLPLPFDTAELSAARLRARLPAEAPGDRAHVVIIGVRRSTGLPRESRVMYPTLWAKGQKETPPPICYSEDSKTPHPEAMYAKSHNISSCMMCPAHNAALNSVNKTNAVPCSLRYELVAVPYTPGILPSWEDAFSIPVPATSWIGNKVTDPSQLQQANGFSVAINALARDKTDPATGIVTKVVLPEWTQICELTPFATAKGGTVIGYRFVDQLLPTEALLHIRDTLLPQAKEYMDSPIVFWTPPATAVTTTTPATAVTPMFTTPPATGQATQQDTPMFAPVTNPDAFAGGGAQQAVGTAAVGSLDAALADELSAM